MQFEKAGHKLRNQSYFRVRTTPNDVLLESAPNEEEKTEKASEKVEKETPTKRMATEPSHYLLIKEMPLQRFC